LEVDIRQRLLVRLIFVILSACVVMTACAKAGESSGETTTTAATRESTTTTISAEQLSRAQSVGDITAGETLFNSTVELTGPDYACSVCHTLDGVNGRSPSLAGISAVAGDRVDGVSDVEYLRESILDPAASEVDEWASVMPRTYSESLSEEQVNNLIAFLLTQ